MKKTLFTFLFLLAFGFVLQAQETPTPPEITDEKEIFFEQPKSIIKEKLHYGGNVWASFFGTFYADVSPMVGYEITDKGTIAGLGASFIYQGQFNQGTVSGTSGNNNYFAAGPRLFVRQAIWRSIFAHAEYELINAPVSSFYSYNDNLGVENTRKWEGSPLIGAGFYQGGSRKQGGSFVSAMYNIGYSYDKGFISPQGIGGNGSPFVLRVGFFL